jgi:hypothetical protein
VLLACLYLGQLASTGAFGLQLAGVLGLALAAIAVVVPPHVLVALALVVFGTFSLSTANPLVLGGTLVYAADVLLALLLLRALWPRARTPPAVRIRGLELLLLLGWAAVMVVAGVRGVLAGYDAASVMRLETPLVYLVGFYVGFARLLRERTFELDKALRSLAVVGLAFVAYMMVARITNSPFETEDTVGRLGPVITTGAELRRDYGFASAFILYPLMAIAGAAYLMSSGRRARAAAAVAAIGVLSTLTTLIRGEIFALFVGLAVLVVLGAEGRRPANRLRAVLALTAVLAVAGAGLFAVDAPLARGIVERSLPGLVPQTETAESTAEYRRDALDAGFEAARREPTGVGLVPAEELREVAGVEPGHVAHSGITTVLVYTGWVGLAAAVSALLGAVLASFRHPRPVAWLHPCFVGSVVVLAVYSITADGLVGQGWVIGLAALLAAVRFHPASTSS